MQRRSVFKSWLSVSSIGMLFYLFSMIGESISQLGCSNPVAKLFSEVQVFSLASTYNSSAIECKNVLTDNCCVERYFVMNSINFYDLKTDTLDFWNATVKAKMTKFVDTYSEFLDWYSQNEASIDSTKGQEEVNYYRGLIETIQRNKGTCWEHIWKHTAAMKCMVCSPSYKTFVNLLRNRTIEMFLDENMCQTIQRDCSDYTNAYIEFAEKTRYMFEWVKSALGEPSYTDIELKNITDYYSFFDHMFECKQSGLCRSLCAKMITAKGFDQNYSVPDIVYTEWFVDTFSALKRLRSSTSSSRRILQNSLPFELGGKVGYDKSWTPSFQAHLRKQLTDRSLGKKSRRRQLIMNSETPNHYEQLKLLLSSYVSSMKYSNSYEFNTFDIYAKVQNMTSVDDYYFARLLSPWIACIVGIGLIMLQ